MAPTRPAALDQPPTLEGAKAVATYFLLLYPYAYQTGDLGVWNVISDPQCVFCDSVRSKASDQHAQGQHLVGGAVTVRSLGGTEVDVGTFFEVIVNLTQAPSRTVDALGSTTRETTGGEVTADVIVTVTQGTWRIRELSTKVRATA